MYYRYITLVIFMALVFSLFAAALYPTPTMGLVLMLLIGFLIVFQTYAVLKGPKASEKVSKGQWYEHH